MKKRTVWTSCPDRSWGMNVVTCRKRFGDCVTSLWQMTIERYAVNAIPLFQHQDTAVDARLGFQTRLACQDFILHHQSWVIVVVGSPGLCHTTWVCVYSFRHSYLGPTFDDDLWQSSRAKLAHFYAVWSGLQSRTFWFTVVAFNEKMTCDTCTLGCYPAHSWRILTLQ